MKNPIVDEDPSYEKESTVDCNAAVDWDDDDDVDPIIAEIRRHRYERSALFGFDMKRENDALDVIGWAAGDKDPSDDPYDPHGLREVELPPDLTGLIPDREDFVETVRRMRKVHAQREPNLTAYNEDARRRALVLGFPAETFVVTAEEVKATTEGIAAWSRKRLEEQRRLDQLAAGTDDPSTLTQN